MKSQVSIHNCVCVLINSPGIPNGKTHAHDFRPDYRKNLYRRQPTYVTFNAKFMYRHSLMFTEFPQEPHVRAEESMVLREKVMSELLGIKEVAGHKL